MHSDWLKNINVLTIDQSWEEEKKTKQEGQLVKYEKKKKKKLIIITCLNKHNQCLNVTTW